MCQAYGAKSGLKEPKLPTAPTPLEVQKPVKIVLICPLQSTRMKAVVIINSLLKTRIIY